MGSEESGKGSVDHGYRVLNAGVGLPKQESVVRAWIIRVDLEAAVLDMHQLIPKVLSARKRPAHRVTGISRRSEPTAPSRSV